MKQLEFLTKDKLKDSDFFNDEHKGNNTIGISFFDNNIEHTFYIGWTVENVKITAANFEHETAEVDYDIVFNWEDKHYYYDNLTTGKDEELNINIKYKKIIEKYILDNKSIFLHQLIDFENI
jgi:hypothetical protein|tara:strand:- start:11501 stop:11866 length:366 start_codon:yes stop_codon:yes gene_type:complete